MIRTRTWILAPLAFALLLVEPAIGACPPSFRGPGGAVPPGLRDPADPTTPPDAEKPPPGSDPTAPPTTTPPSANTPVTPSAPPSPTTGGPATPETGGGARREQGRDDTTWETWWELNKIEFFPRRFVAPEVTGDGPIPATPIPVSAEIVRTKLWPTLLKGSQERIESIQEAAIIALSRVAADEEQRQTARELLTSAVGEPAHDGAHAAALGLNYVADETSIYPLFLAAQDEKTKNNVRAYVALTMTTIGHPMAAGLLRQLADVRGGYFQLVAAALMALGYTDVDQDPWIPEFLEKIYADPKTRLEYRALAVESFGRIGRIDIGATVLMRALTDKESPVRRSAALALGVLDWRTQAERDILAIRAPYEAFLNQVVSAEDAARITELEGKIPEQREAMDAQVRAAVKALATAMEKDGDSFTRSMCAISLGRIARDTRSDLAVKILEKDLKRDRVVIREYDLLALAIARAPTAHELALEAITAKNRADTTRAAGCIALGILGDPKADEILSRTIAQDPHPFVRGYAALALGMIGTPASADVILPLVKATRTPTTRAFGALGLALLGTRKGSDFLVSLLESGDMKNPVVMSNVVYAIGLTKDRTKLDRLIQLAGDKSAESSIRRAAFTAVGYVSTSEFFPRRHTMSRGHNYLLELEYLGSYFYTL